MMEIKINESMTENEKWKIYIYHFEKKASELKFLDSSELLRRYIADGRNNSRRYHLWSLKH